MNNLISNTINTYNDPDKDFKILDDGNNSGSFDEQQTSSLSTHSTNNTENNINLYDLHVDGTAIEIARIYANSASQTIQEQVEETNIDWLTSELDTVSSKESLYETDSYRDEVDIEIDTTNTKNIKRSYNFKAVDEIITTSKTNRLNVLGVYSSHFNFDNKRLHSNLKKEVSINEAFVHRKKCLFCGHDKYLFSRGMVCTGLKVCLIFHENDFTKLVSNARYTRYICASCFIVEGGHLYIKEEYGAINNISEFAEKDIQTILLDE
ncbi:22975_t:CDS:2, partial [Racocetra persica]